MRKIKKPKMIKNKKGILNFGGIISGIGSVIQTIVRTFPKPVLFILFLALLLLLGTLIQSSLHIFGIFCNSADQPMKLDESNLFQNIGLIAEIPNPDDIGLEAKETPEFTYTVLGAGVTKCSEKIHQGLIEYEDGSTEVINSTRWFYDGTFCTDCNEGTIYKLHPEADPNNIQFGDVMSSHTWCVDRIVTRTPDEDKSWYQRPLCGDCFFCSCEPPEHYYYDAERNLYICNDDETCGDITLGETWDDILQSKGAKPLYFNPVTERIDYEGAVSIRCRLLKPRITIFGIEIFDYRLWIFLMIIVIMVWALKSFT